MVWSKIKQSPHAGLYLSLVLFGLPLAIIALALLLWPHAEHGYAKVSNVQQWIEPLSSTAYTTEEFEKLAVDLPDFAQAQWATITLPNAVPLTDAVDITPTAPMARAWFKFNYQLPKEVGLTPDYAIYGTRIMGGAYAVWINDELVHVNLKEWRMQWNNPVYIPIPIRLIKANETIEIKIAVPHRTSQGYAMGSLYTGAAQPLSIQRDIRNAFQIKFTQFSTGIMLLVGLMSFHLWLSRKEESANLLLAITAFAFLICNLQFFYEVHHSAVASQWYGAMVDSSIMWLLTLTYFYAMHIEKRSLPIFEKCLITLTVGLTILSLPIWGSDSYALIFQVFFEVIIGLTISIILGYISYKDASLEFRLITLAQWALMALGVHDAMYMTSQIRPDEIYSIPYGTLGLIFSFIFASQRQHIQALNQVEHLNNNLSETLSLREDELKQQHSKLLAYEKSQTLLLERQRLVRDMHDGIGSSLMTTLAIAKQGDIKPERMSEALRNCLDDLKNVIDSLEPIGHDMTTLLGMLRQRLGNRIEDAGLTLIWQVDDLPPLNWLEPPQALQVSRVVQEVFTNILKHAQATEITLTAQHQGEGDSAKVVIIIKDNGLGFDGEITKTGRGLKHMRKRASEIGGEINISSKMKAGTRVEITLPIAAPIRV